MMRDTTNTKRPRYLTAALPVILCGLAIAACGSSGDPNRPSTSQLKSDGLKFSDCMRSHGVPNFPDPTSNGNGISLRLNGLNPFSPTFKAAQSACHKLLPGGGPGAQGHPSRQAKAQMLAISTCMRAHGITDFPDPTTTPPSSANNTNVIGRDGVFLVLPSGIDINSPAFKTAAAACHFGGPPGGR